MTRHLCVLVEWRSDHSQITSLVEGSHNVAESCIDLHADLSFSPERCLQLHVAWHSLFYSASLHLTNRMVLLISSPGGPQQCSCLNNAHAFGC